MVHLFSSELRFLDANPRNRWLSMAGGVAVAYVLLHLLPESQEYHEVSRNAGSGLPLPGEHAVYVLTPLGLIAFHGLEKVAREGEGQWRG